MTDDLSETAGLTYLGVAVILLLPFALQQRHADQPLPRHRVAHHFTVSGLENMQRKLYFGEKHHIRQRKDRNDGAGLRHRDVLFLRQQRNQLLWSWFLTSTAMQACSI